MPLKSTLFLAILCLFFNHSKIQAQIVINELESDAGNYDGTGGEWIELKNNGPSIADLSCWRLTNGGSVKITIPNGLSIPVGGYLLIGNKSKMMCANCDFHNLDGKFNLNTAGFGIGTGAYNNTIFLSTDIANCNCMTGSGAWNNAPKGDRVVLFNSNGTIVDAMQVGGGDNYGTAAISTTFPSKDICGVVTLTVPAIGDVAYTGKIICNDLTGCNSSFARLPDGNITTTWDNSGNLIGNDISNCGSNTNKASTDWPTPGLANNSIAWTASYNVNGTGTTDFTNNNIHSATTTINICSATSQPILFNYSINNFQNVANTPNQIGPNNPIGSYYNINNGAPQNWTTLTSGAVNFNPTTGVTTLSGSVNPPIGTTTYEFVWGEGNTTGCTCPGAQSVNSPSNATSSAYECYISRKIIVNRLDAITTATINCFNGINSVTVTPTTNIGTVNYTLKDGATVISTNNTGIFTISTNAVTAYTIEVSGLCNSTPIIATGNICVAVPPCPNIFLETTTTSPSGVKCPGDIITLCPNLSTSTNLPIGGTIEWYKGTTSTFDPYLASSNNLVCSKIISGCPSVNSTISANVVFNRIIIRPSASDGGNGGEYIQIVNLGSCPVDISCWGYIYGDANFSSPKIARIPSGTTIACGGYYEFVASSSAFANVASSSANGAGFYLFNATGAIVQSIGYGSNGTGLNGSAGGTVSVPITGTCAAISVVCPSNSFTTGNTNNTNAIMFMGSTSGTNQHRGIYRTSNCNYSSNSNEIVVLSGGANTTNVGGQCAASACTVVGGIISACCTYTISSAECNNLGNLYFKAIVKPINSCTQANATTTAVGPFTVTCPTVNISGNIEICVGKPLVIPITITPAVPLGGTYTFKLSNGTNIIISNTANAGETNTTAIIEAAATTVSNGTWVITNFSVTGTGVCAPNITGSVDVTVIPIPITPVGLTSVDVCGNSYDLSSLNSSFTLGGPSYNWYADNSTSTPLLTTIITTSGDYYVSSTTGVPSNCESSRLKVSVKLNSIPAVPTISCSSNLLTILEPLINCTPTPCNSFITGVLEYSPDGINWSTSKSYSGSNTGWASWGASPKNIIYVRNPTSTGCINSVAFNNNPCNGVLPIGIISFYSKNNNGKTIDLFWELSQNKNVKKCIIQQFDGTNFIDIKTINATNNISNLYEALNISASNFKNIYRLKILDIDESISYSKTIIITKEFNVDYLSIYPSPAKDFINIEMYNTSLKIIMQLCNVSGKIIMQQQWYLNIGLNKKIIELKNLSTGIYFVKIISDNKTITEKIIKQ